MIGCSIKSNENHENRIVIPYDDVKTPPMDIPLIFDSFRQWKIINYEDNKNGDVFIDSDNWK